MLSRPYFHNEEKAYAFLEGLLWAEGRKCPHCKEVDRSGPLKGKTTRIGLYKCYACRKPFTVTVGTVFERSKVPLHQWLQAAYLLCSSKKGFSAHQLHRVLDVQYKTAWFMFHRLREAMRSGDFAPFGSGGGIVEVDETFIGRDRSKPIKTGYEHKYKVLALVDRATGKSRAMVVDKLTIGSVTPILRENIAKEAHVMTDQAGYYRYLNKSFASHSSVNHALGEYARGTTHTNTIEGYFSIFKRGMKGVYQHFGKQHLHRYLAEFDFRYGNRVALGVDDAERLGKALSGIVGKRLLYRDSSAV